MSLSQKELSYKLEEQFRLIKNVTNAHVDFTPDGEVEAIGIFSDGLRLAKEIKRDVEETFRQVAGYRVNHLKISIIEQKVKETTLTPVSRIRFVTAYQVQRSNGIIEGVVQLEYNENLIQESFVAHQFEMELEEVIANATAKALMQILSDYTLRIDHVREVSMGGAEIVLATVTIVQRSTGVGGLYVGAVLRSKDLLTSVAKAVLDALNRRLEQVRSNN